MLLTASTKQEFAILELLMAHPRQVFAKEDIFEYAWGEPYMGDTINITTPSLWMTS